MRSFFSAAVIGPALLPSFEADDVLGRVPVRFLVGVPRFIRRVQVQSRVVEVVVLRVKQAAMALSLFFGIGLEARLQLRSSPAPMRALLGALLLLLALPRSDTARQRRSRSARQVARRVRATLPHARSRSLARAHS